MKIIHRYSPGIPILMDARFGADSLISGMFGLVGTESTNETNQDISESQLEAQRKENQINRDWNTAEAEKARQFTSSEREAQQAYQRQMIIDTPKLQVQGMRQAGVNPTVAFGNSTQVATGGSNPPSGASGAQASGSMGLSPVPYQAQNLASNFATVAQGLSSLASAKEKGANVGLIETQIENLAIDTQMKQVLKRGYQLSNELQKLNLKYADKKLLQDIQEQAIRMATSKAQGKLFTEQAKLQSSIEHLNKALANYHGQNADYIKLQVANYAVSLKSMLQLNAAQTKAANAQAFEASEKGQTEKELRPLSVRGKQLQNIILDKDALIKSETVNETISSIKSELSKNQSISEQQRKAAEIEIMHLNKLIKSYQDNPSLEKWERVVQYFNRNLPVLGPLLTLGSKI